MFSIPRESHRGFIKLISKEDFIVLFTRARILRVKWVRERRRGWWWWLHTCSRDVDPLFPNCALSIHSYRAFHSSSLFILFFRVCLFVYWSIHWMHTYHRVIHITYHQGDSSPIRPIPVSGTDLFPFTYSIRTHYVCRVTYQFLSKINIGIWSHYVNIFIHVYIHNFCKLHAQLYLS